MRCTDRGCGKLLRMRNFQLERAIEAMELVEGQLPRSLRAGLAPCHVKPVQAKRSCTAAPFVHCGTPWVAPRQELRERRRRRDSSFEDHVRDFGAEPGLQFRRETKRFGTDRDVDHVS